MNNRRIVSPNGRKRIFYMLRNETHKRPDNSIEKKDKKEKYEKYVSSR